MAEGKKSADDAVTEEAKGKSTGTYSVTITGTVKKNGNPDPTPIGDYRVTKFTKK
jgi:hypothetical protein